MSLVTLGRIGTLSGMLLNLHGSALVGQSSVVEGRQVHMGMEVRITIAAPPSSEADRALAAAFGEIARLDAILSDWRRGSELNRLADRAGESVRVSPELFAVLERALEMAAATEGAFDPTVGRLTLLWRRQRATGAEASAEELAEARRTVGWRGVVLDSVHRRVRIATPGTRLDLGAIAKGWILDRARDTLAAHGFDAVLLEAGGDLVLGAPPGDGGWRVAVGDSIHVLHGVALGTSGPSEQHLVDGDGTRHSHVIDPATSLGVTRSTQVTVLARDAATADALATALTLVPRDRWNALLERFGARLVVAT